METYVGKYINMEFLLIIFGTTLILSTLLALLNSWEGKVIVGLAGEMNKTSKYNVDDVNLSQYNVFINNGKFITPITHIPVIVGGSSMEKFGLYQGNIAFVRRMKISKLTSRLKVGDIILIDIKDKENKEVVQDYKFRYYNGMFDDAHIKALTIKNGNKSISTDHCIEKVVGIVDYVLKN